MPIVDWGDWRELDNKANPKVNPCPLCGESQHPRDDPHKSKRSGLGKFGIIGIGFLLFIGMGLKVSLNEVGGFEEIGKVNIENFLPWQSPGKPLPKTLNRYTHSKVNIRKGPGTDFDIVQQLQMGEEVQVAESGDDWVETFIDGKKVGYVFAAILERSPKRVLTERQQLLNTKPWGDFRKARKYRLKQPRKAVFAIWDPILMQAQKTFNPRTSAKVKNPEEFIRKVFGPEKLPVEYDELWVWERDSSLPDNEKKGYPDPFDTHRMYWLKGKVQAHIIGKYYTRNPATGEKVSPPVRKIWKISDRSRIFQKLRKS